MGKHEAKPGKHRAKGDATGAATQGAGKHGTPKGASGGMVSLIIKKLAGERGHTPKHGG